MDAALVKKWESVVSRFHELTDQLMDPSVLNQPAQLRKLTKERAELEPGVKLFEAYRDAAKQLEDAAQILADPSAGQELHKMAADESAVLGRAQRDMEEQAKEFLIPKDPRDEKSLVLEIRAGTGGDEAALFAGQQFRLYTRYAEKKGLKVDTVEASETGIGGYKNIVALVEGKSAYGYFMYEAGVHRVQRVPVTEASGRIHTSTVTVAVMPDVDEVDVKIDPSGRAT